MDAFFTIECPSCSASLELEGTPSEWNGRELACPECGAAITLADGIPPSTMPCPGCRANLPPDAVVCVACGTDLRTGKRLETVVGGAAPSPSGPCRPAARRESRGTRRRDEAARRVGGHEARQRLWLAVKIAAAVIALLALVGAWLDARDRNAAREVLRQAEKARSSESAIRMLREAVAARPGSSHREVLLRELGRLESSRDAALGKAMEAARAESSDSHGRKGALARLRSAVTRHASSPLVPGAEALATEIEGLIRQDEEEAERKRIAEARLRDAERSARRSAQREASQLFATHSTWVSKKGTRLTGRVDAYGRKWLRLIDRKGEEFCIPINALCSADRQRLVEAERALGRLNPRVDDAVERNLAQRRKEREKRLAGAAGGRAAWPPRSSGGSSKNRFTGVHLPGTPGYNDFMRDTGGGRYGVTVNAGEFGPVLNPNGINY
jgi:hypothetical protein